MLRIEKTRYSDGCGKIALDLQVSTVAELPALNEELGIRIKVGAGSIAYVIQTGAWYTLDDNGTWYDTDGNAADSASSNSLNAYLLSAPKNLGVEREEIEEPDVTDKIEKSILYPDEPELTEKEQPEMKKSEPTEGGDDA